MGAEPVGATTEAIITKRQSSLNALIDLKGRTIAVQKGSSAHYLLLASVERSGLRLNDLQITYLQPAYARAAFAADRIDAWSIWDPHLAGGRTHYGVMPVDDKVLAVQQGIADLFFRHGLIPQKVEVAHALWRGQRP